MDMNEYIAELLLLLEAFREPSLSFHQICFRNSFCRGVVTKWSSKYKVLSLADPLGENLTFFVSLGIAEISEIFVQLWMLLTTDL